MATTHCLMLIGRKWLCTDIRNIKVTLRATEAALNLVSNYCWIYLGYTDLDDVFLLNISVLHFSQIIHAKLKFLVNKLQKIVALKENLVTFVS